MSQQPVYQPQPDLPRPADPGQAPVNEPPIASTNNTGVQDSMPSSVMPQIPNASTPSQLPADAASAAATTPLITPAQQEALSADDNDLIEKEWVVRAKALVEKTKDNPHEQNKELNKFKADYVKKRYNKELKVTEG